MIRVTEVLDYFIEPALLAWYKRVGFAKAEQISQEALRVGTLVDRAIQADLRGQVMVEAWQMQPSDTEALNGLSAWRRFTDDHPAFRSTITGIQTELTDGELIGHPDLESTEPTRFGIIDLKTSKAIRPRHWTQVAKYLHLKYPQALAESPFPYFVGILRLDKQTAQYEYQELTNPLEILQEVRVFDAYLTVYRHGQIVRERVRQQREQEVLR